jgi:outer membrane protein assembly factor BamB
MSHAPDTITPDRRANFVALAVIAILLAALYFGIQTGLNDAAFQFLGTAALVILALFAGWLWLAFGAGLSDVARKRVLIAGGIVIASVAIFRAAALRRVGYTGNMRPIYAWRWEAAPNAAVVDAPKESLTDAPAVEPEWLQAPYRYPQFLGPNRHPVIENVTVGRNWIKVKPNQLWKQPIGEGWSSFAVYGELAVTQEQRGNQEFVVCYHLLTGQELWKHADEGRFSEFMGGDGPRATPTIFEDGEPFVCTLGATGTLNCLSLADGKPRWPARNILSDAEALNLQWAMAGTGIPSSRTTAPRASANGPAAIRKPRIVPPR